MSQHWSEKITLFLHNQAQQRTAIRRSTYETGYDLAKLLYYHMWGDSLNGHPSLAIIHANEDNPLGHGKHLWHELNLSCMHWRTRDYNEAAYIGGKSFMEELPKKEYKFLLDIRMPNPFPNRVRIGITKPKKPFIGRVGCVSPRIVTHPAKGILTRTDSRNIHT